MKKNGLFLFALLWFCQAYAQNFTGCRVIDFEKIPITPPSEGLVIEDQFLNDFGVSFLLENGQFPVLAEVGDPVVAFGGAFGSDTPAPGSGIGSFFLTDDGQLFGLDMIPLVVIFEQGIDSFSTCVLDIDFGEFFVIDAFNELGGIVLSDTITDGDPGTGDGRSTCWGFKLCGESVFSIRFEGFRDTPGAFGLGLDNFSFCFGEPIDNNIVIETEDLECDETVGTITVINIGDGTYLYSIDGINYQSSPIFPGLTPGSYTIYVQDEVGCEVLFTDIVNGYIPVIIDDVAAFPTSCGEDNGLISILASPPAGLTYSIDGTNFQEENLFADLAAGTYSIYILSADDCLYISEATVDPSTAPVINAIVTIPDNCNDGNGELFVTASGGSGTLTFELDNGSVSTGNGAFANLMTGFYTATVTDEAGCETTDTTTLLGGPLLLIDDIRSIPPDCSNVSGQVSLTASGGTGQLIYRLDGSRAQLEGTYNGLLAGTYELSVTDGAGCSIGTELSLPIPVCPIYIPNIFSPNLDGLNDEFVLFTNPNYDVNVLKCDIFDRWGELVWRSENFTLNTFRNWWDGTFRGREAMQGVYVYVAEVEYNNGLVEILAGDVTLIR